MLMTSAAKRLNPACESCSGRYRAYPGSTPPPQASTTRRGDFEVVTTGGAVCVETKGERDVWLCAKCASELDCLASMGEVELASS